LRSGRDKVKPAGEPDTHDELRTVNRNVVASLDYSWNENWGTSVQIPWVDRFHEHVFNDTTTGPEHEEWNFQKIGDARAVARYQFVGLPDHNHAAGVQFGLKLPTGATDIRNSEGERAERTLQPGTGTTDLILGVYYNARFTDSRSSWFAQATLLAPLNSDEDFRPGRQLALNTGMNYPFSNNLSGLLQLNVSLKGRDSGTQAEPEDSGSRQAFVSPGLSFAVNRNTRLYGFVQLPIYQYVNGTQLTADRAFIAGWGQVF
jgi:hypothetical protein